MEILPSSLVLAGGGNATGPSQMKLDTNQHHIEAPKEVPEMTIYSGSVFAMAREQFHLVADHLEIEEQDRDRLLYPIAWRP